MPARAVEMWDLRRFARGMGVGPYPGRGKAFFTRLVFTEQSVIKFASLAKPERARGALEVPHPK
jgi:hypothetical protein